MSDVVVLICVGVVLVLSGVLWVHLKAGRGRMSPWPPIAVLAALGIAWLLLQAFGQ